MKTYNIILFLSLFFSACTNISEKSMLDKTNKTLKHIDDLEYKPILEQIDNNIGLKYYIEYAKNYNYFGEEGRGKFYNFFHDKEELLNLILSSNSPTSIKDSMVFDPNFNFPPQFNSLLNLYKENNKKNELKYSFFFYLIKFFHKNKKILPESISNIICLCKPYKTSCFKLPGVRGYINIPKKLVNCIDIKNYQDIFLTHYKSNINHLQYILLNQAIAFQIADNKAIYFKIKNKEEEDSFAIINCDLVSNLFAVIKKRGNLEIIKFWARKCNINIPNEVCNLIYMFTDYKYILDKIADKKDICNEYKILEMDLPKISRDHLFNAKLLQNKRPINKTDIDNINWSDLEMLRAHESINNSYIKISEEDLSIYCKLSINRRLIPILIIDKYNKNYNIEWVLIISIGNNASKNKISNIGISFSYITDKYKARRIILSERIIKISNRLLYDIVNNLPNLFYFDCKKLKITKS